MNILTGIILFSTSALAQVEETITVGSTSRQMIVYAPAGIVKDRPLVISMHGMNQTMNDQKNQTQFMSVANTNKFVLVFPNAINKQWQLWGTTDIDFILAIIDEMYNRYQIDRDRVYLSGFSMGGMMTYYAATQIADKIAAYAPVSGFLMSGPNTNSSRPIPIIHIHGADDGYVPYVNVPTHMNAWALRNGNPTPATITSPYPANKPTSKSIKYYWGPGKEGVEMVFIGVGGVGHWYSDDPNGIFSSQEIWNFCSKFSLKLGVPEFVYASVCNNNPSQIQVTFSKSITDSGYFKGFTVKVNNLAVTIDSVVLADTNKLVINLVDSIKKDNNITLAYSNGNVISVFNKKLANFNDTLVDNLLKGASPRITGVSTNENGDSLKAKFNMKMLNPSDVAGFTLVAEYNDTLNIPILTTSIYNKDSSILLFSLGQKVYRDYKISFTYSGNNVASADSGLLKNITGFEVTNNANGLPVHIGSGKIESDGITLSLLFSKPMAMKDGQSSYFALKSNGENVSISGFSVTGNTISFTLTKSVHYGDTATLSYVPGNVKAADNGPLEAFNGFSISSLVQPPAWLKIPGKIEAENFTFKFGMQTENTGDTGGGLNLGYIGNGNWLEYTIENETTETEYQIAFRVAAPNTGGVIDYYIDDIKEGSINVPSTGNWQVYKSVDGNISISPGKHYLKVVAKSAGFNLNYMNVHKIQTGIDKITEINTSVYPNPVSNQMIINSAGFKHNKIEIFNVSGKLAMQKATTGEPVVHVPVYLSDGIYFVKISNPRQYKLNKIVIVNNPKFK